MQGWRDSSLLQNSDQYTTFFYIFSVLSKLIKLIPVQCTVPFLTTLKHYYSRSVGGKQFFLNRIYCD